MLQEAAAPPVSPLEARWRANIDVVLEHLLPILRTRQLRGAVTQTLSDTLGVTPPSMARLLEQVLRSRSRPGEPLLRDFLALLGTGLSGAYFANPDLTGQAAVVRVDPELTFSWAGAPPAAAVPGRRFSVRWTGHLLPRAKGPHTFYIQTDGAVRLVLKVDEADRVLIDQPATGGTRPAEHTSEPIALEANRLYDMRLEYRNQGEPGTLSVQFGTTPAAKQPVPTPNMYPAGGLSSFAPVEQSYRRLHKAALILTGFGVTDAQLEWLTGDPPYLNLDALPMAPGAEADAVALFRRWRQLASLFALRKKLPRSNTDLFDVFRASTMTETVERLVLATGWDRGVVEAFLGPDGMAIDQPTALRPPLEPGEEPLILRLARAVDVQRRAGVAPATLYGWANAVPDADGAATIVQAVKARYDEPRWLEVARTLNDPLRAERRDALVAYLLPRLRHLGVTNRNQLFEYFLIDVEMNPCMLTSRIRQATGTVQTFFQRCLMNLEPKVPPRVIDDNDWKWLKNYRVWEANRKVFLTPRTGSNPSCATTSRRCSRRSNRASCSRRSRRRTSRRRSPIISRAWTDRQAGRARRVVRGARRIAWSGRRRASSASRRRRRKWAHGTYHVFARTFNAPHVVLPPAGKQPHLDAVGKRSKWTSRAITCSRSSSIGGCTSSGRRFARSTSPSPRWTAKTRGRPPPSEKTGRSSWPIPSTTAASGRANDCRPAACWTFVRSPSAFLHSTRAVPSWTLRSTRCARQSRAAIRRPCKYTSIAGPSTVRAFIP